MSRKTCPNCQSQVRRGDAIMKCRKCATIYCPSCGKGFSSNKCPTCGTKASSSDIIARG